MKTTQSNRLKVLLSAVAFASNAVVTAAIFPAVAAAQNQEPSRDEFHAALDGCLTQVGASGNPRELDDATRASVDACLAEKGFNPPPERGGDPHKHGDFAAMKMCLAEKGITLLEPKRGERPALDDVTRNAIDECETKLRNPASNSDGGSATK